MRYYTTRNTRYNRISERFPIMLAILTAFQINLSGAHAQSNTEYSFQQQSLLDGTSYGSPTPNNDPVPVLSMDCLAAKGFRQWTLSSTAGLGTSGSTLFPLDSWYLLENALREP